MSQIGSMVVSMAAIVCAFGASAELPAEYLELEYIESSGTQYVDTQVVPGAMFGVTARLNTGTYKSQTAFFGTDWTSFATSSSRMATTSISSATTRRSAPCSRIQTVR